MSLEEQGLSSAEVVRAELEIERSAQEKRFDSVDSRANTLLGFSGVITGLALNSKSVWALPAAAAAAAAAVLAASVVTPRSVDVINPRRLRLRYGGAPADITKRAVLDTRVGGYDQTQAILEGKVRRLRWTVRLVVVSILLAVVAVGVDTIVGGSGK